MPRATKRKLLTTRQVERLATALSLQPSARFIGADEVAADATRMVALGAAAREQALRNEPPNRRLNMIRKLADKYEGTVYLADPRQQRYLELQFIGRAFSGVYERIAVA